MGKPSEGEVWMDKSAGGKSYPVIYFYNEIIVLAHKSQSLKAFAVFKCIVLSGPSCFFFCFFLLSNHLFILKVETRAGYFQERHNSII